MGSRQTFTEKRRHMLARKVDQLDAFEHRNMITKSLGIALLGIGIPGAVAIVQKYAAGGAQTGGEQTHRAHHGRHVLPFSAAPAHHTPRPEGGGGGKAPALAIVSPPVHSGDWLTLKTPHVEDDLSVGAGASQMLDAIKKSAARTGGGAGSQPRGGGSAGDSAARGAITPLQISSASQGSGNFNIGALGASVAASSPVTHTQSSVAARNFSAQPSSASPSPHSSAPSVRTAIASMQAGVGVSGGGIDPSSIGDLVTGNSSQQALGQFTYWPLYVVDNNDGVVLFPNADQFAVPSGLVDLRAQVSGATGLTFSWDTTNLSGSTGITGASTYRLQFKWNTSVPVAGNKSTTLTVTDGLGHQESQTINFQLATAGGASPSGGSNATWPTSLAPNTVLGSDFALPSHNATVDSNSGALDTSITLPSYNPNIPAIAIAYDSLTADSRPIIVVPHELDPALTVPTKVSAQLTFNSSGGTTWYYDTSSFIPGDIEQIALQTDATALTTGRYAYSVSLGDIRGSTTTSSVSGTATVLNYSGDAFGNGWTLKGLEQITTATGGVILDVGMEGKSLWFTSSGSGGSYTAPAGEFSALVKNFDNTYTRTLTDGTKINFNTSGQETAMVDTNNLRVTYAYSSGRLSTITDPYGKITTFAYDVNNKLSTITDPASRITTFTHSSGNLTGVTMPDSSTWGYSYDGSNRLAQITDQRSNVTTITYDSVERISTITLPDSTTQEFSAYQEQGWTNSGTSGSPAAATLLAAAPATYTDQLGNVTQLRPDWNGGGLTTVETDALGNVTTMDRDGNGLATVVLDRLNRATRYRFDGQGNVTSIVYADGSNELYTYNSVAEVLTFRNALTRLTTYTYDGNANLMVVQDPVLNLTTMTYTADGMPATEKNARDFTTSYAYDSQDRLTTVSYPDTTTELYLYDSKGNPTTYTDNRGNVTAYRYDAMNRGIGVTDALTNLSTYTYDSAGNLTVDQQPLSRTTSYAYDAMNRLVTITDPLAHNTVLGYDADGNQLTIKDPLGRVTTTVYDADNRRTVVIDPMSNRTTTVYDADAQTVQVSDPVSRITTITYNNRGWAATVIDSLTNVTTYAYTATGQPSTVTSPNSSGGSTESFLHALDDSMISDENANGAFITYQYDGNHNLTAVTDANSNTTSYAYDSRDRLTTITDSIGDTTVYGYDGNGNQITLADGLGHTTTTAYDAFNRATTVVDPLGNKTVTNFDAAGRVSSVVDPVGNRTSYAYDANDNVTMLTTPVGTTTYVYDADKELIDETDANSRRTTFAYDADGRRTNERWLTASGGTVETLTYTYDADGDLTAAIDPNATLTFTYDSGGNNLTAATSSTAGQPNVNLSFGYDGYHNRTSLVDNLSSVGTTIYSYDAAFRLTTIAQIFGGTNGPQVVFGYDPGNRLISEAHTIGNSGTDITTSFGYDSADRLTTLTHQISGGATLATYVYLYDSANRVTTEIDAQGTLTYGYDIANELTSASGSRSESYSYDSGGNRTGTGYSTGTDNEMTLGAGYTYAYDSGGNLTSETQTSGGTTATTFSYDYRNRITGTTERSSPGGTITLQVTYTYDAMNRRIGTDVGGTQAWTVYDGQNPYAQFNGSGTLQERYLFGPAVDQILARTSSGGTSGWYLADRLGSVRNIVDSSGSFLDKIAYGSFGNVLSETNSTNGDQFKFAGMQYDSSTGLYFDNARYYNPAAGRFVSQDPMSFAAGDPNLYRYVFNDATNLTDSSGLQAKGPRTPQNPIPDDNPPKRPLDAKKNLEMEIQALKNRIKQLYWAKDAKLQQEKANLRTELWYKIYKKNQIYWYLKMKHDTKEFLDDAYIRWKVASSRSIDMLRKEWEQYEKELGDAMKNSEKIDQNLRDQQQDQGIQQNADENARMKQQSQQNQNQQQSK